MKNARPVSEVRASPLGHFCGLGLLDACLTHSKSVSVYSKDDPRVKGWPTRVRIVQYSHGLTRGCFCSPCSHVTAMTARKGLLLKCQVIKINSKTDGCRKTDLFSKDVLWSLFVPMRGLAFALGGLWNRTQERFIPVGNCLNAFIYPFCIPVRSVAILSVQVDKEGMFDHALGGCRSTWNTPSWHCFPHSAKLDFCIALAGRFSWEF